MKEKLSLQEKMLNVDTSHIYFQYQGVDFPVPGVKVLDEKDIITDLGEGITSPVGAKNPFKPLPYTFQCEVSDTIAEREVFCNFLLSSGSHYRVYLPRLIDKLFPPALSASCFLVNILQGMEPKLWMGSGAYFLDDKSVFCLSSLTFSLHYLSSRYRWTEDWGYNFNMKLFV